MRNSLRERRVQKNENHAATGIAIGVAIGVALGVSTNNLGLWLPIGIALGVAIGSSINRRKKNNGTEPPKA